MKQEQQQVIDNLKVKIEEQHKQRNRLLYRKVIKQVVEEIFPIYDPNEYRLLDT